VVRSLAKQRACVIVWDTWRYSECGAHQPGVSTVSPRFWGTPPLPSPFATLATPPLERKSFQSPTVKISFLVPMLVIVFGVILPSSLGQTLIDKSKNFLSRWAKRSSTNQNSNAFSGWPKNSLAGIIFLVGVFGGSLKRQLLKICGDYFSAGDPSKTSQRVEEGSVSAG
jgi:hypothetical protein